MQVRRKAIELLARLPQLPPLPAHDRQFCSSFCVISRGKLYQIVPTIPIPINDEMVRDGVPISGKLE